MSAQDYPHGGYAFPEGEIQHLDGGRMTRQLGMTLRDYFAAQAMAGYLAGDHSFNGMMQGGGKQIAGFAYCVADSMLEERSNPKREE